jgi:hypothetical protein
VGWRLLWLRMQKRRDRPRDPDPSDRRGHQFGSERQTPAEWEVNRGQRDRAPETFHSPQARPDRPASCTRWLGAPPDAPTATPRVKPNCDRERRGRDSNPRTRQTRVSDFQDRGIGGQIPLVERSAVTGGKPGGKKRRSIAARSFPALVPKGRRRGDRARSSSRGWVLASQGGVWSGSTSMRRLTTGWGVSTPTLMAVRSPRFRGAGAGCARLGCRPPGPTAVSRLRRGGCASVEARGAGAISSPRPEPGSPFPAAARCRGRPWRR